MKIKCIKPQLSSTILRILFKRIILFKSQLSPTIHKEESNQR